MVNVLTRHGRVVILWVGRWVPGVHGHVGRDWGWRRAVSVRLDRTVEGGVADVGLAGLGSCGVLRRCRGARNAQHMDRTVFSSPPFDRRTLPPWRGGDVKFARRRERVFDLVALGLIRSFHCALSSAF